MISIQNFAGNMMVCLVSRSVYVQHCYGLFNQHPRSQSGWQQYIFRVFFFFVSPMKLGKLNYVMLHLGDIHYHYYYYLCKISDVSVLKLIMLRTIHHFQSFLFQSINNLSFNNLREKILAWTRDRTRVSSSMRWRPGFDPWSRQDFFLLNY